MAEPVDSEVAPGFSKLLAGGEKSFAVADAVAALVADAAALPASDIHIDPDGDIYLVRFRAEGVLTLVGHLERPAGAALVRALQVAADIDTASSTGRSEGRYVAEIEGREISVRVASAAAVQGHKLTLRILGGERSRFALAELGMVEGQAAALKRWMGSPRGMVLVAGPTGMGKTTTAYAVLAGLAERGNAVISLEDPVEMTISGMTQIGISPDGQDSFADGLRHVLRLDPDVLFIGEVRSRTAAHSVLDASFSGHGVISTMHSRDPVGAVTVLRSFEIDDHEIAASLKMVIGQRLFRRLCPDCSASFQPSPADFEAAGLEERGGDWRRPFGCRGCAHTGFKGMQAAFDVWELSDEHYEGILQHRDERELRALVQTAEAASARDHALRLARAGELWISDLPPP